VRKRALRLATVTVTAVGALAYAGDAFATQTLSVSQPASALAVTVSQDETDPQPAKIQIYTPSGYSLNTSLTPGTKIGTATGDVIARDQANLDVPLSGDVVVDDPAKHTENTCSPGTNLMVLVMGLTVAGQAYDLPVYVNQTSADEVTLGGTELVVCFDPTDTPVGAPNRSPFGAQLKTLKLSVDNLFTLPSRTTRWTSLWTPYASGTGVPNPAELVEARAYVGLGKITLTGRVTSKAKRTVMLTGRVTFAGLGVGMVPCQNPALGDGCAVTVDLLLNGKLRFHLKTAVDGVYRIVLLKNRDRTRFPVATSFFQARTTVVSRNITSTGCVTPAVPTARCVSATANAFTAVSKKIKIRV
jgi:hypothetical protein